MYEPFVHAFYCFPSMLLLLRLSRFSRVQLWDPIDGSPPGSSVAGILQAKTLEWVAISFSNACMHDKHRQHIKRQRHNFADKDLSSQSYGFSISYVWI